MERQKPSSELFATPEDQIVAQKIVEEELGSFCEVDYLTLPKNVGIKGDARAVGHSLLVSGDLPDPARFAADNSETLARLSIRLCNETSAATRVLFDITPPQLDPND